MADVNKSQIPQKVSGADLSKLNLQPAEGFILSQIDGRITVDELKLVTGLPEDEVKRIVGKLVDMGTVKLNDAAPRSSTPTNSRATPPPTTVATVAKTASSPKTPPPAAKEIPFEDRVRDLYTHIDEMDFYSILGVDRFVDKAKIKIAFHKLSREYHPDKLFRRGSDDLRERLQYVFARVNEAYKTLSNDKERVDYDKSLRPESASDYKFHSAIAAPRDTQVFTKAAESAAPKKPSGPPVRPHAPTPPPRNPFTETILKAKGIYEEALKEMKRRSWDSAAKSIRIAMTLDPFNKTYPETLQKIDDLKKKEDATRLGNEGASKEKNGDYEEAARCYREASVLDEANPKYYIRWARILIEHKMQAIQAKAVIKKAFDLGAKEAEAFLVMGLVLADSGQRPQAIAKMEEGLELNPGNKDLEKELKKIRKGK